MVASIKCSLAGVGFVHKPLSHRQWSTSHVLDILTMSMFSVDWGLRGIGKWQSGLSGPGG